MTTGLLAGLMSGAADDAAERATRLPLEELGRLAGRAAPPIDALAALAPLPGRVHVIAEVKRSSPSRGAIAAIADPAALAAEYERGGAAAISVLTEGRRFGGSLADLAAVRARVALPVLRKDFVSTAYQVVEARAAGADLVLLIVAGLADDDLRRLHDVVRESGMTALVEVHDERELDRALATDARLLGVNARDLDTFELDRGLFGRLRPRVPAGVITVAESAVRTPADVHAYRDAGADVVLVGEALVTGGDPAAAIGEFRAAAA